MSKINIPVTDIEVENIHLLSIDKKQDQPMSYIDINFNLLSPNGKKVGTYNIKKYSGKEIHVPTKVMIAFTELLSTLEEWGAQEALNELKLIEAKGEESDEQ